MRRLFYLALGATVGILVVRRASAFAEKFTPAGLAGQASGLGDQARQWWTEVRDNAAEREAELREALGIDGSGSAGAP